MNQSIYESACCGLIRHENKRLLFIYPYSMNCNLLMVINVNNMTHCMTSSYQSLKCESSPPCVPNNINNRYSWKQSGHLSSITASCRQPKSVVAMKMSERRPKKVSK